MNWYKKAQEEDDLLNEAFEDMVREQRKSSGEWVFDTVCTAVIDKARQILSKTKFVPGPSVINEIRDMVTEDGKKDDITRPAYILRMGSYAAVSALLGQSIMSIEVTASGYKEIATYAIMLANGWLQDKESFRKARERYGIYSGKDGAEEIAHRLHTALELSQGAIQ